MSHVSRRTLLQGAAAFTATLALPTVGLAQPPSQTRLTVGTRTLDIKGKAATVFGITDPSGRPGLIQPIDQPFNVRVINTLAEPTVLHWHGLTPPFASDGSNVSQPPIPAGGAQSYQFALTRSGTNWMHSHFGLQEAQMLAAPLIIQPAGEAAEDRQTVTVILHDFSFTPPQDILARLQGGQMSHVGSGMAAMQMGMVRGAQSPMAGMDHSGTTMATMPGMDHGSMPNMAMDLNDVRFDAFLANDRDLSDPEIVPVERNGKVRLRIINAASSSNFWIETGQLSGRLIAVDGNDVLPVSGSRFEIAMAQRLDIDVTIPAAGAFPILAQLEGAKERTGIILGTPSAKVARISDTADVTAPPVLLDLERQLSAQQGLGAVPADVSVNVDLTGDMGSYVWGIGGATFKDRTPIDVQQGQRVEITMRNATMMSHPMHLHGHHFQVVGLGRARLPGAVRDTVLVPPMESITIAFDANNPGEWPLHCHNLYHMAAGMMTTLRYI